MTRQTTAMVREQDEPERLSALQHLDAWLRTPMLVLSFVWLALVVVELVWGTSRLLEVFGTAIWVVFIIEFLVRLALAPDKLAFLKGNWLAVLALVAPALRLVLLFRVLRFARAARGLRLVRIVGTANRSMNALRASLGRRGLGYVLVLTVFVALLGAGGMLGAEFWPKTAEGRLLCFLLSLYGFAVFGYITASFASFFVGRDAVTPEAEVVGAQDLAALRIEIALLRRDLGEPRRE
jgi:voltage-gated potassium channel